MDIGSVHSLTDLDLPLPSTPEEKKAESIKHLSFVLGLIYSLLLIIFGFLTTPFVSSYDSKFITPALSLYLSVSGIIVIVTIIVNIELYNRKIGKAIEKLIQNDEETELQAIIKDNADNLGDEFNNTSLRTGTLKQNCRNLISETNHSYCYSKGRHAVSTYLKLGAAVFALGNIVHLILLALVDISALFKNSECVDIDRQLSGIVTPCFVGLQLFFVFKYANVIVVKHQTLAYLALMHLMASNLCQWVVTVTEEIDLAVSLYEWQSNINNGSLSSANDCYPPEYINKLFVEISPYLYPFSVEFSIFIVGIYYMIWSNIGKCRHTNEETKTEYIRELYDRSKSLNEADSPQSLSIHIDCQGSSRGMFIGMIFIVILCIVIIMGFLLGTLDDSNMKSIGYTVEDSAKLFFHAVMLAASIAAYIRLRTLDVNLHPIPLLDDILLYICVPAFFLETIYTVTATLSILNVLKLIESVVMSIQMVVQTLFIVDGLRRCCNSRKLRRTKPGRELVLFLLITNVAMWFMYTLSYKSIEGKDERYLFYGKKVWTEMGHFFLPLIMFYRFHSSACIADIWLYAYKPGIEDH